MNNFLLDADNHKNIYKENSSPPDGFRYYTFKSGYELFQNFTTKNYLVFFIEGLCFVSCNQFHYQPYKRDEMVLIPRNATVKGKALSDLKVLTLSFDQPMCGTDKFLLEELSEIANKLEYDFKPTEIRYPINLFIDLVIATLHQGISCKQFHELKHQELFLYFRRYYSKQEIAFLLHPILGKDISFKDFVVQNYLNVNSIDELIAISAYSRASFYRKFNLVFGMPIKRWIHKQKASKVLYKMEDPYATLKDVMAEIEIDSPTQFNRFCRKYFGRTPKELFHLIQSRRIRNSI